MLRCGSVVKKYGEFPNKEHGLAQDELDDTLPLENKSLGSHEQPL